MAKRFTDTDKWKKPWFSELQPIAKLTWIYMLDDCDHAGIWNANFKRMSFDIGTTVTPDKLESWFFGKIIKINAEKYFIPSFLEFQYGSAKDGFKAKASALNILRKYGLVNDLLNENNEVVGYAIKDFPNPSLTVSKELDNTSEQLPNCPSISIGKSKSISIGKNNIGNNPEKFQEAYSLFPVRLKGTDAEKRFAEQIKTEEDFVELLQSLKHYCEYLAKPENAWRAPKQSFETFLGTKRSGFFWRQWIEKGAGETVLKKSPKTFDPMTAPLGRG